MRQTPVLCWPVAALAISFKALALPQASSPIVQKKAAQSGVIVERVEPNWPGDLAGLTPGDVIESYAVTTPSLRTPPLRLSGAQAFANLETGFADLTGVTFFGTRAGKAKTWRLRTGSFGIGAFPATLMTEQTAVRSAFAALSSGNAKPDCNTLLQLANQWQLHSRLDDAQWARMRCLQRQIESHQESDPATVIAKLGGIENLLPTDHFSLNLQLLQTAAKAKNWNLSEQLLKRAEQQLAINFPGASALTHTSLLMRQRLALARGTLFFGSARFADCVAALNPGVSTAAQWVPNTLRLSKAQAELGGCLVASGDSKSAIVILERSASLAAKLAPGSIESVRSAGFHGTALQKIDFSKAQNIVEDALHDARKLGPEARLQVSALLNNLGVIAMDRGDWSAAEVAYLESLAIARESDRLGSAAALKLLNLASLALSQQDLVAAQSYAEEALPLIEKLFPDSSYLSNSYTVQGGIELERRQWAKASTWYQRALTLSEKRAPQSSAHAFALSNLGVVLREQDETSALPEGASASRLERLRQARTYFEQALKIHRTIAPDGEEVAACLHDLGLLAQRQQHFDLALVHFNEAREIRARLMPNGLEYASTLHAIALTQADLNDAASANKSFCQAADIIERGRAQSAVSPARQAETLARYQTIRHDCVSAQISVGNAKAAFELLERGRGESLRIMLAQRDLAFSGALSAKLQHEWIDAERSSKLLHARLGLVTGVEKTELNEQLARAQVTRETLIARLRAASPKLAALMFPKALRYAQLRAQLAPDTALIAISIGNQASYAMIARGDLAQPVAIKLALTQARTSYDLEVLRAAILARKPQALALAKSWHENLITPLLPALKGTKHWVLVPDAALMSLPFSGLIDANGRYLFENVSLTLSDSATLWVNAQAPTLSNQVVTIAQAKPEKQTLLAISLSSLDPQQLTYAKRLPITWRQFGVLQALPFVDKEIEAILAGRGVRGDINLSGTNATEQATLAYAHNARHIHFATHGFFDAQSPLNSGLLLRAAPDLSGTQLAQAQGDGYLQAWEIFDHWRIDADTVTLSACESGLGGAISGEGLIGLTRAFQFAGARSVMASLWQVPDRQTADFMAFFYRFLASEPRPARALRLAQIAMLAQLAAAKGPADQRSTRGVGGIQSSPSAVLVPPQAGAAGDNLLAVSRSQDLLILAAFQAFGGQ